MGDEKPEERSHEDQIQGELEDSHETARREMIHLGEYAKSFLNSDLARYINNSAEAKFLNIREELETVDPTNHKRITELQCELKVFKHYERSLNEIVTAGDTAYQAYLTEFHEE
jgi:hypothetical protein